MTQGGKKQALIGFQPDILLQDTPHNWCNFVGAFCKNNNICPPHLCYSFAHPAGRQQCVIFKLTIVVDKQNVYSDSNSPVLKGIVEQHDIGDSVVFRIKQRFHSQHPVFANRNSNIRKPVFYLQRFVAYFNRFRSGFNNPETRCSTFITPA